MVEQAIEKGDGEDEIGLLLEDGGDGIRAVTALADELEAMFISVQLPQALSCVAESDPLLQSGRAPVQPLPVVGYHEQERAIGSFGSLEVNVQSSAPAAVSVNGAGTEMTIVVNGAVVRLRVPDGG